MMNGVPSTELKVVPLHRTEISSNLLCMQPLCRVQSSSSAILARSTSAEGDEVVEEYRVNTSDLLDLEVMDI